MGKQKMLRPLWTLLHYVGETRLLVLVVMTSLLRNVRDLSCVITVAYTTDQVLLGGNVVLGIVLMLITMFGGAPIIALDNYYTTQYYLKSQRKLQRDLSQCIAGLPLRWMESHKSGDVLSTYTSDMDIVCHWMSGMLPSMVRFITYLIGALAYSFSQSILLTVTVFPVIILIVPVITKMAKPLQKTSDIQRQAAADSIADMQEALADPAFIKAYSLEEQMVKRIEQALETKKRAEQKSGIYLGVVQAMSVLSSYLPVFVAAAAGVVFLWHGAITAGFLVGFIQTVVQRFGQALPQMGEIATENKRAAASAKRVMQLLYEKQERQDGKKDTPHSETVLELEQVSFSYGEDKSEVLHHISLHVNAGETVALVGNSGSGKSTVLKLCMGLYETQQGKVKVLGRDVKDWNLAAMRDLIAPVFQEAALFPTSISENVAGQQANDGQIEAALEHAGLGNFMEQLPEGIHTKVGERGVTLSGGQQQRVTIARALVKDAPIILLDEPTSALDTVTENEFQMAFETLKQGKTTVVVAHRLQTIRGADRIYVLDHGRIVQEGTHETLIAQEGIYRRLYQSQAKESGVR